MMHSHLMPHTILEYVYTYIPPRLEYTFCIQIWTCPLGLPKLGTHLLQQNMGIHFLCSKCRNIPLAAKGGDKPLGSKGWNVYLPPKCGSATFKEES